MNKITPDHLSRSAYVYVRQSTPDQLINNPESRRRQYGLATRARALGWENVIVIDDDLGRSGGGTARPGFERLLAAICTGTAGAVLAIEASRLARNGRDWHTLLESCTLVNSLIIDEDGVYDWRTADRCAAQTPSSSPCRRTARASRPHRCAARPRRHRRKRTRTGGGDDGTTCTMATTRSPGARDKRNPTPATRSDDSLGGRRSAQASSQRMQRRPRKGERGGR